MTGPGALLILAGIATSLAVALYLLACTGVWTWLLASLGAAGGVASIWAGLRRSR